MSDAARQHPFNPKLVFGLIAANIVVFLWMQSLPPRLLGNSGSEARPPHSAIQAPTSQCHSRDLVIQGPWTRQSGSAETVNPDDIRASSECLIFHLSGLSAGSENFPKNPGQK